MKTSESINEIATAMSKAQSEMRAASKDSMNPHFRNKYADMSSVWDAVRMPLTQNNLTVWQDVVSADKSVSVVTRVVHSSGQWVEFGPLSIPLSKFDAQAIGSATSYAKRYAISAALGVVSGDDDDGNSAVASAPRLAKKSPSTQQFQLLNETIEKLPEESWAKAKEWMMMRGFKSVADISAEFYPELLQRLLATLKKSQNDSKEG